MGTKFLYDVAFGLIPRNFSDNEDSQIIYDEEEEVAEMYFIISGSVGIGYHLFASPLDKQRYRVARTLSRNEFFGDFYLCNNVKSEFVFCAQSKVEAFALRKEFLVGRIFSKYPQIFKEIRDESRYRYQTTIKSDMVKDKNTQIELANKRTLHNTIYVKQKEINFSDDFVVRNRPVTANSGILLDDPSCLTESF